MGSRNSPSPSPGHSFSSSGPGGAAGSLVRESSFKGEDRLNKEGETRPKASVLPAGGGGGGGSGSGGGGRGGGGGGSPSTQEPPGR